LVEAAQDLLEELGGLIVKLEISSSNPATSSADAELLDHLAFDQVSLDKLAERSGLTVSQLSAMLLTLELEGRVSALPGGFYQRIH
jgi:DNA processing protein